MCINLFVWLLLGAILGEIFTRYTGRSAQMGRFANVIVGAVGAVIGGFLVSQLGSQGIKSFNAFDLLGAVGGALVLLLIMGAYRRF